MRSLMSRRFLKSVSRLCALIVVMTALTAGPAAAQSAKPTKAGADGQTEKPRKVKAKDKRGLVWDNRPSLVFGKNIHVDFRAKGQFDWRAFDPDVPKEVLFAIDAKRAGLKGELTKHFEFEIEREVGQGVPAPAPTAVKRPWKDVYLNWRTFKQAEVIGGRFKIPFGYEQLTGKSSTDFAYRSLISSTIAPARERGVMVHGRFFGRGLTYEVGGFKGDGDNGRLKEPQFVQPGETAPDVGPSVAGRVTATVLRSLPVADSLKGLRLGVAYTNGELPEGLNSVRGKSEYGTSTFFRPVYVKGRRQRLGAELSWSPGPVGVRAEWMQAREDRKAQGNRNQDLSAFLSTGWYASGTWILTGENKGDDDDINPRKPLFKGGIGSIEIGAKYDELAFGSARHEGTAFSNPRADNLIGAKDQVWTMGVNWFPNRWVRVIGNAIHEDFENASSTPVSGITAFWSGLCRLQIAF